MAFLGFWVRYQIARLRYFLREALPFAVALRCRVASRCLPLSAFTERSATAGLTLTWRVRRLNVGKADDRGNLSGDG
jgi:hypothetical protein